MNKKVLIAACVYHTEENGRLKYIKRWFVDLMFDLAATNFNGMKVRVFVYDNSPTSIIDELENELPILNDQLEVAFLGGDGINLGTAGGINECWKHVEEGEYLMKMDDDVIINFHGWLREMVEVMERMPEIGILALKRNDLTENPLHPNPDFRTELMMAPQVKGQQWYVVEKVKNVFGTVQMYSPELFRKIGYMEQIGPYGFDDFIMSVKCYAAGKIGAFLPHISIKHIDEGGTDYTIWKQEQAGRVQLEVTKRAEDYKFGLRELYYDGGFKKSDT